MGKKKNLSWEVAVEVLRLEEAWFWGLGAATWSPFCQQRLRKSSRENPAPTDRAGKAASPSV